jgi:hypothetical protein
VLEASAPGTATSLFCSSIDNTPKVYVAAASALKVI